MDEIARIDDQLRRAFEREAWSGPALLETLEGVDAATAARRPLPRAHSIWEIVRHVAAWHEIARRRLEGGIVEVTPSLDWPPVVDTGPAAWDATLEHLRRGHAELRRAVRAGDPARLEEPVPDAGVSRFVLLLGVPQHDLYHAGQIALLKKA